jgi:hypothetical protein
MPPLSLVSTLIPQAFSVAKAKYPAEHQAWITLSHRLAGRSFVPLASMDMQRLGDLDLLLRCMEDELVAKVAGEIPAGDMLGFHYQKMFSEMWIGGWYEIMRAIRQRAEEASDRGDQTSGLATSDEFNSLLKDFERLRIPLEKYEIAKDKVLKKPLTMKRYPPKNDETDDVVYDRNDRQRSHHMPSGPSGRGSITWLALDHTSDNEYWIERRDLSERLLALTNHPALK